MRFAPLKHYFRLNMGIFASFLLPATPSPLIIAGYSFNALVSLPSCLSCLLVSELAPLVSPTTVEPLVLASFGEFGPRFLGPFFSALLVHRPASFLIINLSFHSRFSFQIISSFQARVIPSTVPFRPSKMTSLVSKPSCFSPNFFFTIHCYSFVRNFVPS